MERNISISVFPAFFTTVFVFQAERLNYFSPPFPPYLTPLTFILPPFSRFLRPVLHIFRTMKTARGSPREIPRSKGSRCYYYYYYYYSRESTRVPRAPGGREGYPPCEFDQVDTRGGGSAGGREFRDRSNENC